LRIARFIARCTPEARPVFFFAYDVLPVVVRDRTAERRDGLAPERPRASLSVD
jgi:hypothetical protein